MAQEGDKALAFTLHDQDGETKTLDNYKGSWLVLYFYPKDDTPGCTIEANDFTRLKSEFDALNTPVVGVSPDNKESHCGFIEKFGLNFTLLCDEEKALIEGYGLWAEQPWGMGVTRTTLLIDPEGNIKKYWTVTDVNGHVEEILTTLKELQ